MNSPSAPLISLTHIVKKYQIGTTTHFGLNNVSIEVDTGDMLAIVGASGSGKSTLMNIIGLLDDADDGRYVFQQKNIHTLNDNEKAKIRNQSIGFVFQQFQLLPRFTALQNVALPLSYRRIPINEALTQAMCALNRVGMQSFSARHPMQLSGGQQQRIAIARALIAAPKIILADEPTGALDSKTSQDIMRLFLSLHQEGRTIILVTHDEKVASVCSKRIVLADGRRIQ